ncbi:cation diffusion facilitator family transporter [Halogeometricum borinquense DSM 11551]|uniref:Cation diffusion facilitator family transporter n=2 Tax=Halogeometricum borinquense TaxID=60847 RepID=E4NPT5_HALBP|nr:cation diffusion facilitator family transporter [Halogeometricum borinquense]ADQ66568.1 cation diffusion facilitator family transporter [Halogeometricum borinquense DSM 11551]ELY30676.1 cation diffusion facilitator family transporter [Halogeometricum borinquense DSM 11551]RYJ14426.1 cation transporter [Halogeometricum borinquense]
MRRVGLVILAVNVGLALAKAGVWWTTGSLAVGSEAVNSASDAVYSVIVLAGLYLTTQPPDFEHPHGHERIEPFVSLFVAVGVFAAGAGVLWNASTSVLNGTYGGSAGVTGVAVLVVSGGVKYGLYRYCLRVGEQTHSPAIIATALDNRNDILTAGAALVGVLGASAGVPILDPIAAGVVSLGIIYTGYEIVRDNVNYLVGAAPPDELTAEILSRALEHPEVKGAHDVVAHYVGPEIDVSLHIEVEGDMTLFEAHDIESKVVESIGELPEVDDVFVHIDPKELGEWKEDDRTEQLFEQRTGEK